jgi:hypothetical protein
MPPLALTPAEKKEALEKGSSELKFLLGKEQIPLVTQERLFHSGATTLAKYSVFFADEADLRVVAKDELGIDPTASLQARGELAGLIVCYQQSKTRTAEVSKYIGELDARQQTKPIGGTEFLGMRLAFEKKYAQLEDQECPSRLYLEKRIAELEGGEMRAEQLKTVLNREQDGEEALVPTWDAGGQLKLKKAVADIDEPSNPEELRRRLGVMFNGLCFIALAHTNKSEFQSLVPSDVHTYAAYLLGEHVYQFVARDENGMTVASPNWGLVLAYEFAIRKRTYRRMMEVQLPFKDLLKESWLDSLTKDRFFTTPLAISAAAGGKKVEVSHNPSKRPAEEHWSGAGEQKTRGRGRGKGGSRGRGKGGSGGSRGKGGKGDKNEGGLSVPKGCAAKTPDGRPLCYGYNCQHTRCRKKDCSFVHVCGLCFQKHPMYACNGKAKFQGGGAQGETQGTGA